MLAVVDTVSASRAEASLKSFALVKFDRIQKCYLPAWFSLWTSKPFHRLPPSSLLASRLH